MKKSWVIAIVLTVLVVGLVILMTNDFKFGQTDIPRISAQLSNLSSDDLANLIREILWKNPEIVRDVLWARDINWVTFFESLDGFDTNDGTGSVSTGVAGTQITFTTTNVNNEFAELTKKPQQQGLITFSQPSRFRTNLSLGSVVNETAWIVHGSLAGQAYGFKIINGSLYGFTRDSGGTENTVLLQSVSASQNYNLEARYFPDQKVVFLADDPTTSPTTKIREVGISKINMPSPAEVVNTNFMDIRLQTNTTAVKTMTISFFQFNQSRNVLNY